MSFKPRLHQKQRKQRRHRGKPNKTQRNNERSTEAVSVLTQLTLNHFANCEVKPGGGGDGDNATRRRGVGKPFKNLTTAVNKLSITENSERAWDDDEEEDEVITIYNDKQKKRGRGSRKEEEEEEGNEGINYPLDIWFMVSKYVRPEDVGRFACVCKATCYITTTVEFWVSMFRRHYQWCTNLPESLTYYNLDQSMKNVRVNVIRALFFMYQPFVMRISNSKKPLSSDPTQLTRAECILQWHQREGKMHKYFFKFVMPLPGALLTPRLWKGMDVLSKNPNPHAGCWLLEAVSVGVCDVGMVMGQRLYHAGLGLSSNLCSHRLNLSFVPTHLLPPSHSTTARKNTIPATEIVFDPVINVCVYPWWHPKYWSIRKMDQNCADEDW